MTLSRGSNMAEVKAAGNRSLRNKAFFFGCCLLLFSAYLFFLISRFPDTAAEYRTISPTFFPYLLTGVLAGLSLLLMVEGLRTPAGAILSIRLGSREARRTGMLLLILTVFALSLTTLGFVLDAFLFMVAVQLLLGERRFLVLALAALGVSFGMYFVFATLFMVPLPTGVWPG